MTSNYFVATDSAATSSFSGSFSVGDQLQLSNLSDGIISALGGFLTSVPTFVYNSATGFLGVGTSTKDANHYWEFVQQTSGGLGAFLSVTNYNSGGASPLAAFMLRASRGTEASPSALLNGDILGKIFFNGYDGTSFTTISPALIDSFAQDNWTATDHGTGLGFFVTGTGNNCSDSNCGNNGERSFCKWQRFGFELFLYGKHCRTRSDGKLIDRNDNGRSFRWLLLTEVYTQQVVMKLCT